MPAVLIVVALGFVLAMIVIAPVLGVAITVVASVAAAAL